MDSFSFAEQIAESVINCSSIGYPPYSDSNSDSNSDYDDNDLEDIKTADIIPYNIESEMYYEELDFQYHYMKDTGNWYYAKMIITGNNSDKNATEFLWDYLESQFKENNDDFSNIQRVYYKSNLDLEIKYDFEREPGKYLIENLKIPTYKPDGYIFCNNEIANKWSFKIVVVTQKGFYSANRYINNDIIGFY